MPGQIDRLMCNSVFIPPQINETDKTDDESDKSVPASKRKMKDLPKQTVKEKFKPTEEEETVPKKDFDKKVESLNKKISALEAKNDKLSEEKKTLSDEKKALNSAKKESDKKIATLEKNLQDTVKERDEFKTNLEKLKKEMSKPSEPQVIVDDKEIKRLKKELEKSEDTISGLQNDNGYLNNEIERLISEIESLRISSTPSVEEMPEQPSLPMIRTIKITRNTASDFYSDAFTDGNYSVDLARDMSVMIFRIDIMGAVVCKNKTISIPAMSKYIPFSGPVDRNASVFPDGTIKVALR